MYSTASNYFSVEPTDIISQHQHRLFVSPVAPIGDANDDDNVVTDDTGIVSTDTLHTATPSTWDFTHTNFPSSSASCESTELDILEQTKLYEWCESIPIQNVHNLHHVTRSLFSLANMRLFFASVKPHFVKHMCQNYACDDTNTTIISTKFDTKNHPSTTPLSMTSIEAVWNQAIPPILNSCFDASNQSGSERGTPIHHHQCNVPHGRLAHQSNLIDENVALPQAITYMNTILPIWSSYITFVQNLTHGVTSLDPHTVHIVLQYLIPPRKISHSRK